MNTLFLKKELFEDKSIYVTTINGANTDHDADHNYTYHSHDFYEFELISDGYGFHDINDQIHEIKIGYCYLLTPADFHRHRCEKNSILNLTNVKFDNNILGHTLKNKLYLHSRPLACYFDDETFHDVENLLKYLEKVTIDHEKANTDIPKRILELICTIFETFLLNTREDVAKYNPKFQAALNYMQQNFKKNLTREMVAGTANMSPCYFSDYFNKMMGISFVDYLKDLRTEYAAILIKNTSLSLKEIAYESGFNSPLTFTKAFKQKYGVPPSDYATKNY